MISVQNMWKNNKNSETFSSVCFETTEFVFTNCHISSGSENCQSDVRWWVSFALEFHHDFISFRFLFSSVEELGFTLTYCFYVNSLCWVQKFSFIWQLNSSLWKFCLNSKTISINIGLSCVYSTSPKVSNTMKSDLTAKNEKNSNTLSCHAHQLVNKCIFHSTKQETPFDCVQ